MLLLDNIAGKTHYHFQILLVTDQSAPTQMEMALQLWIYVIPLLIQFWSNDKLLATRTYYPMYTSRFHLSTCFLWQDPIQATLRQWIRGNFEHVRCSICKCRSYLCWTYYPNIAKKCCNRWRAAKYIEAWDVGSCSVLLSIWFTPRNMGTFQTCQMKVNPAGL